jgi:hypothetical protein
LTQGCSCAIANEREAGSATFAEQPTPTSAEEVDWGSPRSVGMFAGQLAADTAPQMAAMLGASLINPALV